MTDAPISQEGGRVNLEDLDVPEPSDGWQETYDPDNPLAMLEKAAAAGETEQGPAAVRAIRAMLAAGADVGVLDAARGFVKRHKLLSSIAPLMRWSAMPAAAGPAEP